MGKENYVILRHYSPYKEDKKFSNIRDNITNQGIYFFGRVIAINTATKEIVFNYIENRLGAGKLGTAKPMFNNVKLPTIGNIVTLQRGPDPNVDRTGGQYSKIIYYIGTTTVEDDGINNSNTNSINTNNYSNVNNGFSNNGAQGQGSTEARQANPNIKITLPSQDDINFYKEVLTKIGAPITDENLKFFYAWRKGEGGVAAWNPFNTTKPKPGATAYNCKRGKPLVKNYPSRQVGIEATVETLLLTRYYSKILSGLKSNIGAGILSSYFDELETWGTGRLVNAILAGSKLEPKPIATTSTIVRTCN